MCTSTFLTGRKYFCSNDVAQEPDTNSEKKEVIPDVLSATKLARTRPQIFTATSAVPKPLFGYRPFKQQVGGHLMVQDDPCKYLLQILLALMTSLCSLNYVTFHYMYVLSFPLSEFCHESL